MPKSQSEKAKLGQYLKVSQGNSGPEVCRNLPHGLSESFYGSIY